MYSIMTHPNMASNNMQEPVPSEALIAFTVDDWTKSVDKSNRRRIQNRISQRNRRKALKQSLEESGQLNVFSSQPKKVTKAKAEPKSRANSRPASSRGKTPEAYRGPEFISEQPYQHQANRTSTPPTTSICSFPPSPEWINPSGSVHIVQPDNCIQPNLQEYLLETPEQFHQLPTPPMNDFVTPQFQRFHQSSPSLHSTPSLHGSPLLNGSEFSMSTSSAPDLESMGQKDEKALSSPFNPGKPSPENTTLPVLANPSAAWETLQNAGDLEADFSGMNLDVFGNTGLHLAAQKGHLAIIRILIEFGLNINLMNEEGRSPMHIAAMEGHARVVQFFLELGADYNLRDLAGQTALHVAASKGHAEILRLLLSYGADTDAKDLMGKTAFHTAVMEGEEGCVRVLLDRGVNPHAKVGC